MSSRVDERGQATVELAVSMILLTILFLLLLQLGLVARDQVLVTQAAREGARAAAVDPTPGSAAAAAARSSSLNASRLGTSSSSGADGFVTVKVTYRSKITMPVSNQVLLEPQLTSQASMRIEDSGDPAN